MFYSIKMEDLIKRPIIRSDKAHEFLNKMTDEEIDIYYKEVYKNIKEEGIKGYPDTNVAFLSKIIDSDILYHVTVLAKLNL